MAFNITATAQAVQTHLKNSELFFSVDIERPGQPRGEGPSATIQLEGMRVVESTLVRAIELHTLRVRLWRAMNTTDLQAQELEASTLTAQVLDLFYGDFTLGGGIRAIDVAGIYGRGLEATFTEESIDNAQYHIADITVPLIVDSATDLAA